MDHACPNDMERLRVKVPDGLRVETVDTLGRSVVATRIFRARDWIVRYWGELITEQEAFRREERYDEVGAGSYMFFFVLGRKRYCVDATCEDGSLGRLVNHSRMSPNAKMTAVTIDGVPALGLRASKLIRPDDHIFYDYGEARRDILAVHPWLTTS